MKSEITDSTLVNFGRLLENLLTREPEKELVLEQKAADGLADYLDLITQCQPSNSSDHQAESANNR